MRPGLAGGREDMAVAEGCAGREKGCFREENAGCGGGDKGDGGEIH